MKLAIASCTDLAEWEVDDQILFDELRRQNIDFTVLAWDSETDWSVFDCCLIRTTWDYSERVDEFKNWLNAVSTETLLLNPLPVLLWNIEKSYLRDLEKQGIPIAPSVWIEDSLCLRSLLREKSWERAFLKPIIGASASNTFRFSCENITEAQEFLDRKLKEHSFILQPYLSSVETEGEYSALFFNGKFSHAVQKIPVSGDYRVQDDYGASDYRIEADKELLDLSQAVLERLEQKCLYARVDALRLDNGSLVLNELELIEPSLFFRHSQTAAKELIKSLFCYRIEK